MAIEIGDLVGVYTVLSKVSGHNGMSELIKVESKDGDEYYLKYCKNDGVKHRKRFKREVRLMLELQGNSKIVNIIDSDLSHSPPYFVMPIYKGDLSSLDYGTDWKEYETVFNQMADCLNELHQQGQAIFHRDVKPQNYLEDEGGKIVISDLGLSVEVDSGTNFTSSDESWGTKEFLPPEFYQIEGFKNADQRSDIFMLGKSFYSMITKKSPQFISPDNIPAPLFSIIEKSCHNLQEHRYQNISDLKQSMLLAFDALLNRKEIIGQTKQLLQQIYDKIEAEDSYKGSSILEFLNLLLLMEDKSEQFEILRDLTPRMFRVIAKTKFISKHQSFLRLYEEFVQTANFSWSFAETIAANAKMFFISEDVENISKSKSLDCAMHAAVAMNRFAAMDTCVNMITNVQDDALAMEVVNCLEKYKNESFVHNIEPVNCKNDLVRKELKLIQS